MKLARRYCNLIIVIVILSILSMTSFALAERENVAIGSNGIYYLKNTFEIWENTNTVTTIQDVNYTYYMFVNTPYTSTYQYNDFTVYRNGIYLGRQTGSQNNTSTMVSRLNVSGSYFDSYTIRGYARATCPLGDIAFYHNYN